MRDQYYTPNGGSQRPGDPLNPTSYNALAAPLAHLSTRITRIGSVRGLTRIPELDATWQTVMPQSAGLVAAAGFKDLRTEALSLGAAGADAQHTGWTHEVSARLYADFGLERIDLDSPTWDCEAAVADKAPANGDPQGCTVGFDVVTGQDIDALGVYEYCDGPAILWACRRWGYSTATMDCLDWFQLGARTVQRAVVSAPGGAVGETDPRVSRLRLAEASDSTDTVLLCVPMACSYATDPDSEG